MKNTIAASLTLLFLVVSAQLKINGLSFVASNNIITNGAIQPVVNLHANWVSLMPFGFMKSESDTTIIYNSKRQWWGETKIGIAQTAIAFHDKKCQVMLKPQIWIQRGGFTGNISMITDRNWAAFENNYVRFILDYAQVAADNSIEIFCIGTELNKFVVARPAFWKLLIAKIKNIYKGKITYAENWDTYKNVSFLASLDYIGIDAYFPLSKNKTPSVKTLRAAWQPLKTEITKLSLKYKKPILFTEFGYQSKDYAVDQPWNHQSNGNVNLSIQCNGLQALFAEFWTEKWFAGGFLWKWYDNNEQAGGSFDTDYTVQNKPAEKLVQKIYKKS